MNIRNEKNEKDANMKSNKIGLIRQSKFKLGGEVLWFAGTWDPIDERRKERKEVKRGSNKDTNMINPLLSPFMALL